jgi:glutamate synthase (NADPH/NADH) small chain
MMMQCVVPVIIAIMRKTQEKKPVTYLRRRMLMNNVFNNYEEVAIGFSEAEAIEEAKRCLHCKNKPCQGNCPVNIDIPAFIAKVETGEFEEAYNIITQYNYLPAVCGRVCPQEVQCEGKCVRGIKGRPVAIGKLERFVADYHREHSTVKAAKKPCNGHKVAIIGAGPAGLSCAGELARNGYDVTIYEALHTAGGVLVYGIPEFRLPKAIVKAEIQGLIELGVKIETNMVIGKIILLDELFSDMGFESVFIGSGSGSPIFMKIEGENFKGVYSANEFLTRMNLMKAYEENTNTPVFKGKRTVVIGGGNVAMDSARCAKRLGSDVTIVYRRTEKELPAKRDEVEHAMLEGIDFKFLTNPIKIKGNENKWVESLVCQSMELGECDASGRARPVVIENSEFEIKAECVIIAIGTTPNPLIKDTTKNLNVQKWGGIIVDDNGLTSKEDVYAGGDAVTGSATVILAMGAGKKAAKAIMDKIGNKS